MSRRPSGSKGDKKKPAGKGWIWLCAAIGIVALAMFLDGSGRYSTIQQATAMNLSDRSSETRPVSTEVRERNLILPTSGIDGKWWVMHTEQMIREGAWRVRHTAQDNSPVGREVHWSSGLMWLLGGMAFVIHWWTAQPVIDCVAHAAVLAGPVMMVIALGGFGSLLACRYGLRVAAFGIFAYGTCFPLGEFFRLGDCDHHGMVGWFAMVSVFCLAAGGAGFVSKDKNGNVPTVGSRLARRWFIASGIAGAAALWVSAATEIPVLAGIALGALLAGWALRRNEKYAAFPELWRTWGLAGGLTSLGFYALEYFPSHLGWRLEVNHPVFAFAWWGGGDLLCRLLRKMNGQSFVERLGRDYFFLGMAVVFLAIPVLLVALLAKEMFWVSDRFLLALHTDHIGEFQPFFKAIFLSNPAIMLMHGLLWPVLTLIAVIYLSIKKSIPAAWMAPLSLTLLPSLVMLGLAMMQVRWLGIAAGLWVLLGTLVAAMLLREKLNPPLDRRLIWVFCSIALVPVIIHLALLAGRMTAASVIPERLARDILPNVLARDVVHRIAEADPEHRPVILGGPTTSTEFAYYGGVGVIGTLYWENMPGLKAAADIFAATDTETAKKMIIDRGITHVLLCSWDEFAGNYACLRQRFQPEAAKEPGETFMVRLLEHRELPSWLRPLYYPVPPEFGLQGQWVQLFEVVPEQTPFEAAFNQGVYHFDAGEYARSAENFRGALNQDSSNADAQLYLGLALIRGGQWEMAREVIAKVAAGDARILARELDAAMRKPVAPSLQP